MSSTNAPQPRNEEGSQQAHAPSTTGPAHGMSLVGSLLIGLAAAYAIAYGLPKLAIWYYEQVQEGGRLGLSLKWIASFPGAHKLSTWMSREWNLRNVVISVSLLAAPLLGAFLSRKLSQGSWLVVAATFSVSYTLVGLVAAYISIPAFSPFKEFDEMAGLFIVAALMSTVGARLAKGSGERSGA